MSAEFNNSVLLVGGDARTSAFALHLAEADPRREIFAVPGTLTTEQVGTNLKDIDPNNMTDLARFSSDMRVGLTIVLPEGPLAAGVIDQFNEDDLPIFGPTKEAAQLEASKAWATELMRDAGVPHPTSHISTDFDELEDFLRNPNHAKYTVVKADGLTDGKGVAVCSTVEEAVAAARGMMVDGRFGEAGRKVVLQERRAGSEISVICVVAANGQYDLLPIARDNKRLQDNDEGPNTGGMGAHAPTNFVDVARLNRIRSKIIEPTLREMQKRGIPFQGFLYAGLILDDSDDEDDVVIEFNVRPGDPETQVQLPLVATDLGVVAQACLAGTFRNGNVRYRDGASVSVVLAAPGYPESPQTGQEIRGLDRVQNHIGVSVLHAGTKCDENGVVRVAGGRVVNVRAIAATVFQAHENAYRAIGSYGVEFDGMQVRSDIGLNETRK